VQLPSLLLIISLIIWEHLIGLAGIFVSFPALYVSMRIRDLFASLVEDAEGKGEKEEVATNAEAGVDAVQSADSDKSDK
jgi:predicted PurR-regulated permease PerM